MSIHPTSIIDPSAKIAKDVQIGPFCTIGEDVQIESGSKIISHAVIKGPTVIGKDNCIYQFSTIGDDTPDKKFKGEKTKLIIGDNNIFREGVTVHRGTVQDNSVTTIGSNNLFMPFAHVAHDCIVGDNVIFVNGAVIGGHVEIGDYCYLGGYSAIHQFCRIGKHAIIGASTMVEGDVIPFSSVVGARGKLSGLNLVGLKRRSFKRDDIKLLRQVYRLLFAPEGTFTERLLEVKEVFGNKPLANEILNFLNNNSHRSIVHPGSNNS